MVKNASSWSLIQVAITLQSAAQKTEVVHQPASGEPHKQLTIGQKLKVVEKIIF